MQLTKPNIRTTIRYGWLDMLDWFEQQNANLIGLLITALLSIGLIATIVQLRNAPAVGRDPIIIIATPALPAMTVPTVAPQVQQVIYQPTAAPIAPARQVVAFAAPSGDVLGPIPEPAVSAITGRYGDGWVSTTWQGATVWLRVSELGANLANLAPAPQIQPAIAPVVEPRYQVANDPPAQPPEPTAAPESAPAVVAAPAAAPVAAPAADFQVHNPPSDPERNWAQEEWRSEHCFAGVCH